MVFADTHEVNRALATGKVAIHARVKVRVHQTVINENGEREQQTIIVDTTRSLLTLGSCSTRFKL